MRITDLTWVRRASLSAPACVNWNPLEDSCLFEAAQSERSGPAVTPDALSEYCPAGGQTFPPRMVEGAAASGRSNVEEHSFALSLQVDIEHVDDTPVALLTTCDQRVAPHRLLDDVQ